MNSKVSQLLAKYRTALVLVMILVIASFLSDSFLSMGNFINVIRQVSINAVIAAGMTFVILTGGIDLSVGSVVAVAGAFSAATLTATQSTFLAVNVGMVTGAIFGLVNGYVIVKEKVPPFIVTLATMALGRGIVLVYTNGSPIAVKVAAFKFIGKGYVFGIPFPVIILLAVYLIAFYVLQNTKFGRNIYCLGGNREATRLSGVNVGRVELMVYVISGLLAGITGVVLAARLGSAQPTAGTGYELDAIAAVILGGTSMTGGQGFIFSTVIGALILGVLSNLLVLMDVNPFATNIVKGIVILLAVVVDNRFKKLSKTK
jgi:ribose transport system permease protein